MSPRRTLWKTASFILLVAAHGTAIDFADTALHVRIMTMEKAVRPQVVGEYLLFSFESAIPVRHVAAAFAHEEYRVLHDFERNIHGVFILPLIPPPGADEIVYRFVVDGLWMPDPSNPSRTRDVEGTFLSLVHTAGAFPVPRLSPIVAAGGYVEFHYYGDSGKDVYLTGDFNHWDPFMHRLLEETPGKYSLLMRLEPGAHAYRYVVNGRAVLDPLNASVGLDLEGNRASRLDVSKR